MNVTLEKWQQDHKQDINPPRIAWPTVILFFIGIIAFISSCAAATQGIISLWVAFFINALCQYILFTVLHDATHRAVSQINWLNEVLGGISAFILSPASGIRVFRFLHMQHHRFTNEGNQLDPDEWCGKGRRWTLPFRWVTLDLHYVVWYTRHWSKRPLRERMELVISLVLAITLITFLIHYGFGRLVIILWLLPARLAVTWLALAFDFLPHYPHDTKACDNELRATNIHPNIAWLMTPLMLAQNIHLIHHLYPRVPFYRYMIIWKNTETILKAHGARLMRWNGQEIIDTSHL